MEVPLCVEGGRTASRLKELARRGRSREQEQEESLQHSSGTKKAARQAWSN